MTSTHLKFITWHDIDASSLNLIGRPRPTAIEETVIHRRHQTPSDANWHNLTPSDTTWHNLMPSEPSNAIWHNLTLSDAIWHRLTSFDAIWRHLTPVNLHPFIVGLRHLFIIIIWIIIAWLSSKNCVVRENCGPKLLPNLCVNKASYNGREVKHEALLCAQCNGYLNRTSHKTISYFDLTHLLENTINRRCMKKLHEKDKLS